MQAPEVAQLLLEAVVKAGGSRQVVAATTSALFHCLTGCGGQRDLDAEVSLRMEQIHPVVREQVAAAAAGQQAKVSGRWRAARNVATHAGLGKGEDALRTALADPQAAQRGQRRDSSIVVAEEKAQHIFRRADLNM